MLFLSIQLCLTSSILLAVARLHDSSAAKIIPDNTKPARTVDRLPRDISGIYQVSQELQRSKFASPRPSGSSGHHPRPSSELSSLLHLHQSTQLKPACDTKGSPSETSPAVAPAFSDLPTPYSVVGGNKSTSVC